MTFRIDELDIPRDDPFLNDRLGRRESVEFLSNLIQKTSGPFVFAIDSPWGTGKSTFVRMLRATLGKSNYRSLYFDAWSFDYLGDPIVAMVSVLQDLEPLKEKNSETFKKKLNELGETAVYIAKRSTVFGTKIVTGGFLDLDVEVEAIKAKEKDSHVQSFIDSFGAETEHLRTFRKLLEDAVEISLDSGSTKPVIFFIDELDRCRPNFSIALLERVKHLFDVKNIVFVLSIDKSQLESSTRAIYGQGIVASAYLRKFIDIEFGLPKPNTFSYASELLSKFEIDSIFNQREGNYLYDQGIFLSAFSAMADIFDLTLRDIERCVLRLKVVLQSSESRLPLDPIFISLLIILRVINPDLFTRIRNSKISPEEVIKYLESFAGGSDFIRSDSGVLLETYLIFSDSNIERRDQSHEKLRIELNSGPDTDPVVIHAGKIFNNITLLRINRNGYPSIERIASKIDLANQIH